VVDLVDVFAGLDREADHTARAVLAAAPSLIPLAREHDAVEIEVDPVAARGRPMVHIPFGRVVGDLDTEATVERDRGALGADNHVDLVEHWLRTHRNLPDSVLGSRHASWSASGTGDGPGRRAGRDVNTAGKHTRSSPSSSTAITPRSRKCGWAPIS